MVEKLKRNTSSIRAIGLLLGPAFVAAIAYVDPGNFATNLIAGSKYGYLLLWVIVVANLMASLVQYLSAKLGLVTGKSLPEIVRDHLSERTRIAYWLQAEIAAIATDIAEVIGGAIALQLLFNLPLLVGAIITGCVSMLILFVHGKRGQKMFERITIGLLLIIPIGFITGLIMKPPQISGMLHGLIPGFQGQDSVVLAVGILGATVMPHAIYLHSSLARDRHGKVEKKRLIEILKATRIDVGIAMVIAGGVNIAMLLLAATSLRNSSTDSLVSIHQAISTQISPTVAKLFAIGLLASGLAATAVGTYAGSIVMSGLLKRQVPLLIRRLATLVPAILIIAIGFNPTKALILSQVALSFALPFALIPLVKITTNKKLMGNYANSQTTATIAWIVTAAIVALNIYLIIITI